MFPYNSIQNQLFKLENPNLPSTESQKNLSKDSLDKKKSQDTSAKENEFFQKFEQDIKLMKLNVKMGRRSLVQQDLKGLLQYSKNNKKLQSTISETIALLAKEEKENNERKNHKEELDTSKKDISLSLSATITPVMTPTPVLAEIVKKAALSLNTPNNTPKQIIQNISSPAQVNKENRDTSSLNISAEIKKQTEYTLSAIDTLNEGEMIDFCFLAVRHDELDIVEAILTTTPKIINTPNSQGSTLLVKAIVYEHPAMVQKLLAKGADVNLTNRNRLTALHAVAETTKIEIAIDVIKTTLDINARGDAGGTPFYIAVQNNNIPIVKFLLSAGVDCNIPLFIGITPIRKAISEGFVDIAILLFHNGASLTDEDTIELLCLASRHNKTEMVERILDNNPALINKQNKNDNFPLFTAILGGHRTMVQRLLKKGADAKVVNLNKLTVLHVLAETNNIEIATDLINLVFEINARSIDGGTALYTAVQNNNISMVKFLLEERANCNISLNNGWPPILKAIDDGFIEIAILLFHRGAALRDDYKIELLCLACLHNKSEIVESILNDNPALINKQNKNNNFPLFTAILGGHRMMVQRLLKKGANANLINWNMCTILHVLAEIPHVDIATDLIKLISDINSRALSGGTPLYSAVQNNNIAMVKFLLNAGANCNTPLYSSDWTPIKKAINESHIEIAILLYHQGASLSYEERIALFCLTAQYNNIACMEELLKQNPQLINLKNYKGITALGLTVEHGHRNLVQYLILRGANVNLFNNGISALHIAAEKGRIDIAEDLIAAGASINIEMPTGETPLIQAAFFGQTQMVSYLLSVGANVNAQKKDTATALYCAVQNKFIEIVYILLKCNADPSCAFRNLRTETVRVYAPFSGIIRTYTNTHVDQPISPLQKALLNQDFSMAQLLIIKNGKNIDFSSIPLSPYLKNAPPKVINYIWIGGLIPKKYLMNVFKMSAIAKKSGFTVCLWLEKSAHYYGSLLKEDLPEIQGVVLCSINRLLDNLKNDAFYKNSDHRRRAFISCITREMHGLKNLAAAADFLRLEILRKGGYYFDIDTELDLNTKDKLSVDNLEFGILITGKLSDINTKTYRSGNDMIAALPNHPVIINTLVDLLKNYQMFDQSITRQECDIIKKLGSQLLCKQPLYYKNLMDKKRAYQARYKHDDVSRKLNEDRVNLTIEASGPSPLWRNLDAYAKKIKVQVDQMFFSNTGQTKIAGISAITKSDQNWVSKNVKSSFVF